MNAEEMFEELGYERSSNEDSIVYHNSELSVDVEFYLEDRTTIASQWMGSRMAMMPYCMPAKLHLAVNQQLKELGWIE